jgi:uncharacterized phage protein (TIGR01671 family)
MREIKFRAWDKIKNEMCMVTELGFDSDSNFEVWEAILSNRHASSPCTKNDTGNSYIMQYTGLKDKNGKEIYEGDIVQREYFVMCKEQEYKRGKIIGNSIISFTDGSFLCGDFPLYDTPLSILKVIGNIYENPELLKGGMCQ